jgi:hypothetical protein
MIKETPPMTETAVENEQAEQMVEAPSSAVADEQLVTMLVDRARNDGTSSFFRHCCTSAPCRSMSRRIARHFATMDNIRTTNIEHTFPGFL